MTVPEGGAMTPTPREYVARFPLQAQEAKDAGAIAVIAVPIHTPEDSPVVIQTRYIVRREWDDDGPHIDSDSFATVGEALTVALDRAGLYDDVAARIAGHSVETAAFAADTERFVGEPGEAMIDASWQEHRGDEAAAREAGYFDADEYYDMHHTPLVIGKRYRVTYRAETQRVNRVCVMVYLGKNTPFGGTDWSLRPHAGTQHLRDSEIMTIERTDAPVMMPKKA